jgi:N-glycosylase/DNA lyase
MGAFQLQTTAARFLPVLNLLRYSFDPTITFDSGQVFRWKQFQTSRGYEWIGIVSNKLVRIDARKAECIASIRANRRVEFEEEITKYLSLQDNLDQIHSTFPKDPLLNDSIREYTGLRILTQDPWECLVSFVCSINKNIPSIKRIIELLSKKFGSKISSSYPISHTFPDPSSLAKASKNDLISCKLGFRWKFVQFIAKQVQSGKLDLEEVNRKSYEGARRELISELSGKTFGVGPKVADCVLLFSMHKLESFPIDIWMQRCIRTYYTSKLNLDCSLQDSKWLTAKRYEMIRRKATEYFGRYSGYAQQYLYMRIRKDSIRNIMPV